MSPLLRTATVGKAGLVELRPCDNAGTGALALLAMPLVDGARARLDRAELVELREAIDEALA